MAQAQKDTRKTKERHKKDTRKTAWIATTHHSCVVAQKYKNNGREAAWHQLRRHAAWHELGREASWHQLTAFFSVLSNIALFSKPWLTLRYFLTAHSNAQRTRQKTWSHAHGVGQISVNAPATSRDRYFQCGHNFPTSTGRWKCPSGILIHRSCPKITHGRQHEEVGTARGIGQVFLIWAAKWDVKGLFSGNSLAGREVPEADCCSRMQATTCSRMDFGLRRCCWDIVGSFKTFWFQGTFHSYLWRQRIYKKQVS